MNFWHLVLRYCDPFCLTMIAWVNEDCVWSYWLELVLRILVNAGSSRFAVALCWSLWPGWVVSAPSYLFVSEIQNKVQQPPRSRALVSGLYFCFVHLLVWSIIVSENVVCVQKMSRKVNLIICLLFKNTRSISSGRQHLGLLLKTLCLNMGKRRQMWSTKENWKIKCELL